MIWGLHEILPSNESRRSQSDFIHTYKNVFLVIGLIITFIIGLTAT